MERIYLFIVEQSFIEEKEEEKSIQEKQHTHTN